ncbi:MAG: FAD-dependent 5-carboxymethylaminomethyl-2-thiouridine(34) oxidoreductase MnmC, partial [Rhodospirillaceae bacterium]|nr:FAD-dependent 5-carboxymethylaminomethyl-2-thiouridine(34) oxidoreductase MnmC [Rhodospirillaceae bacterium]
KQHAFRTWGIGAAACRRATKLYDRLDGAWLHRGLLAVGRDDEDAARFRTFAESDIVPDAEWLDPDAASARVGLPVALGGAWFANAGTLNTTAVCQAIAGDIAFVGGAAIVAIQPFEGGWQLLTANGEIAKPFTAVVFAAGHAVGEFADVGDLELVANRGQVTRLPASPASEAQTAPISYGGYLTPPSPDHVLGSSFERINDLDAVDWRSARDADNRANLEILAARLPQTAAGMSREASAWVGMRGTTQDRMPFVGALPDRTAYEIAYADLHHGRTYQTFPMAPYRAGLFVFSGLGARGFLTAPLAADILAAQMRGAPTPQPKTVLNALHPARFLIRDLKRRRTKATITKV